MTAKSETEILGALDELLSQLPDDAARDRAFVWLRAKHAAKPAVKVAPAPAVNPPVFIPVPMPAPETTFEITCEGPIIIGDPPGSCKSAGFGISVTTVEPQHRPPEFFQAQGDMSGTITGPFSIMQRNNTVGCNPTTLGQVWTGETTFRGLPPAASGVQTIQ